MIAIIIVSTAVKGIFWDAGHQEQMRKNRRRILAEASRLFREKGFEAVGVAEVMKAAGLTHGGFYGHFASKEDLMWRMHRARRGREGRLGRECPDFLNAYLSPAHRDDPAGGCPMAALAADVRLRPEAARSAMTAGIRSQIARMEAALADGVPEDRRREAIGTYAAMLGALILARAVDEPVLSDEILGETRRWLDRDA